MPRRILKDATGEHAAVVEGTAVSVDGGAALDVRRAADGSLRIGDAGQVAWAAAVADAVWVFLDGEVFVFDAGREGARRSSGGPGGALMAPMPATVVRVDAAIGGRVSRGDVLIVLEAMKMELPVRAPADGTVTAIHCRPGELVQPGVTLVEVGPGERET